MEFIDLKSQYKALKADIDKNILEVINSSRFIGGPFVEEFENKLAEYINRKYCISCASGTDALQLSFMTYGIGKGDAIFCPDMTFIASIEPAVMLGATPIFCDIDLDTYNIDPEDLENKIKEVLKEGKLRPSAVVAVDFLGNPAKHKGINKICKKYNLIHIEDGAQSTGATYFNGLKCGSLGDISTTSFFPSKPLGCYGDGGAVFTDSDEIANIIKSLKVHGKGPNGKYDNVRIGVNSRLDAIQAAILLPKLSVLQSEINKRQDIAKIYDEAFNNKLKIPKIEKNCISSYAQYCLLADNKEQRNIILNALKKSDIPSLIYYPNPLHTLDVFKNYKLYGNTEFPNTQKYADCNFGLPFSPYLTNEDQLKVINTVLSVL